LRAYWIFVPETSEQTVKVHGGIALMNGADSTVIEDIDSL